MAYVPADRQETDQQLFLTLKGMDIFSVSIALQPESSYDQGSLLLPFGLNSYVKKVLSTFTRKIHKTSRQNNTLLCLLMHNSKVSEPWSHPDPMPKKLLIHYVIVVLTMKLKVSVKENEVATEKNSTCASIFVTKASYISN